MAEMAGVNIAHPEKLFIGGAWVSPRDGGSLDIVNPNSEQIVATVAAAGNADMDAAVAAARAAFDTGPWPRMSPQKRAGYLRTMADWLERRSIELGAAWTAQIGALPFIAPMIVGEGVNGLRSAADVADTFEFEKRHPSNRAECALVVREPVGVVAAITPWNAPFPIMCNKVGPALVAGCTVVMKPSPETPMEAYLIMEAGEAAGLPPGVLNLVPSDRDAADHLVNNPGVDKVTFTGSTVAGRRIAQVCGGRMARYTLELGGKSAAIILDDYPTETAAKLLANTITVFSGQVCAMLSRAIVPAKRHDEMAEAIAHEMRQIRVGYSDAADTMMGPLAMKRQMERVQSYIDKGQEEGATLVQGGGRPSHLNSGYFIEPTLFANVDNRSTIAQEEIFGPVLSLIPADDLDDAIRIANESQYGLSGSVLTNDPDQAYRVARRVRTGNVSQNGMRADFNLPFGGFKMSGIGREGGAEGLMNYLETKTVLLDAAPSHIQ